MSNYRSLHNRGLRARLAHWRHRQRKRCCYLLARLLGTVHARPGPLAANTRRILVVRMNRRLGNILFLTPLLRTLAATLPEARIDVLIHSQAQKELLHTLPGVYHVWVRGQHPGAMWRTFRALRRQHYDLAIDPTGNSTSNRVGLALVRARQRLGFARCDQWLRLSHAAPRARQTHQALQGVELLEQAITWPPIQPIRTLAVFPGESDHQKAGHHWQQLSNSLADKRPVIGFFRHATVCKTLPASWWQRWLASLQEQLPEAVLLEILATPTTPPLQPQLAHIALESLTELAALMSRLDDFVAPDSGPMHLASAAGIPVLGLFQTTPPEQYAPLGSTSQALFDPDGPEPDHVVQQLIKRHQQRRRSKLAASDDTDMAQPPDCT